MRRSWSPSLGKGGEVFVLDVGRPIRILDMAHAQIRLYGFRAGKDIGVVFTGLRTGECLHKKLFNEAELILKTDHPKILMAINEDVCSTVRGESAEGGGPLTGMEGPLRELDGVPTPIVGLRPARVRD